MAKKILSTNRGVPVVDNRNSLAAGQRGPVLTKEIHIIEKQEMTL
jgi:catalase